MLKAKIGDMVILGLDHNNVERLQQGKPILFNLSEVGLEGKMTIMYGDTLKDVMNDLETMTGAKLPDLPPSLDETIPKH